MLAEPSPATGEVAAKPSHHAQQSKETSPGSLLQCGQGTPTAPTGTQTPVQLDGNTTHQGTPTNNAVPAHPKFTHPSVTPQTSPIEQQSPIRSKLICCLRIPLQLLRPPCPTLQKRKYQNCSMERESRIAGNKLPHLQLIHRTVDSALDVNSLVT